MAHHLLPKRLRMPVATLLLIVVTALLFVAALYRWQDRLLYFPERAPLAQLATGELRPWPSAQNFRGLVAQPPGPARGTVIVFHGNAGHAGHRAFYAHSLVPLSWRVVLAEYPGYGPRGGAPGEATLVADARQTLALVRHAWPGPLLVAGESLGAAVAAGAAAGSSDLVSGLLLISKCPRTHVVADGEVMADRRLLFRRTDDGSGDDAGRARWRAEAAGGLAHRQAHAVPRCRVLAGA
jgi:pimeloyl-ACP methyl ester carboxylesterase